MYRVTDNRRAIDEITYYIQWLDHTMSQCFDVVVLML